MAVSNANDWDARLKQIYPNDGVIPDTMMVHVFTWCSEVDRLLIRNRKPLKGSAEAVRINHSIVKSIAWIIALCNEYKLDFTETLLARFPTVCPYCQLAPCRCEEQNRIAYHVGTSVPMTPAEARRELEAKFEVYKSRKYTFDNLIEMLRKVYPANQVLLGKGHTSDIVDKLLEEGGELKGAYAQFELAKFLKYERFEEFRPAIAEEIADLSAWLFSCWDITREKTSFDGKINEIFKLGCNTCNSVPCGCIKYHASFNIDKTMEKFKDELERASRTSAGDTDIIDQARSLVAEALSAPTAEATMALLPRVDEIAESEVRRFTMATIDRLILSKRK